MNDDNILNIDLLNKKIPIKNNKTNNSFTASQCSVSSGSVLNQPSTNSVYQINTRQSKSSNKYNNNDYNNTLFTMSKPKVSKNKNVINNRSVNNINCHKCKIIQPISKVLTCSNKKCRESFCFSCLKKQIPSLTKDTFSYYTIHMRQQLTAIEADKNRLYGSVAQAVNVIEEKYGAYKEVALNDQSYESYVENMRQLYENTSAEYRSLTGRIERLTKELYALEGIRHDVERLMKLCHVQENLTTETLDEQIGLKRRYEELLRRYEQMQSQYFAKRDAFEKDKAKAVSELHQLGAEGLAAELREHLSLPENAEAAGRVMQEIEETIAPVFRISFKKEGKDNLVLLNEAISTIEALCNELSLSASPVNSGKYNSAKLSVLEETVAELKNADTSSEEAIDAALKELRESYQDFLKTGLNKGGLLNECAHLIQPLFEASDFSFEKCMELQRKYDRSEPLPPYSWDACE